MHNRAIEQEQRKCRQRWVVARDQLRVWRNYLATQKTETWYPGALKHHENVLDAARGRMREAAAARLTAAARVTKAEESSSLRRLGRLCARWRDKAHEMEALADECDDLGEEKDAAECNERARTFRECAADLEREWAGTEPTDKAQAPDGPKKTL